ncbi:MAG: outer membrane beta-barrel protein [Acidobacteriia bacterium]|nr:outer membrane beta-barrel protein [Terriglobia bacterium]
MNRLMLKIGAVALALTAGLFALAPAGLAQDNDWKGFYVGGNVGGAFGSSDAMTTISDPTSIYVPGVVSQVNSLAPLHPDSNGITGGGQIGYNFQHGHFLLGGEFDFGSLSLNKTVSSTNIWNCCAPSTFVLTQSMKTSWLVTLRPRVGYATKRVLVYGTVGLAMTNVNYQATFTDNSNAYPEVENGGVNKTQSGYAAGGGIEYKISSRWSLKGEYLYGGFGSVKATSNNLAMLPPGAATLPGITFIHMANLHANVARAGVNFRF